MNAPQHETVDAPPRIALLGLGVLAGTVVAALILAGVFLLAVNRASPQIAAHHTTPPAPRLEVAGGSDLARIDAAGARRLTGYGWTDRKAGLAHIPLNRAMTITAGRGWADQEAR